jgi:hypothetical protein
MSDVIRQLYLNDTDVMPLTRGNFDSAVRDSRLDTTFKVVKVKGEDRRVPTLTAGARLVYRYLCSRGGLKDGRWTCFPSFATIAEGTGFQDVRYVKALVNELVDAGLIERERRKNEDGLNKSNIYVLPAEKIWAAARANMAKGTKAAPASTPVDHVQEAADSATLASIYDEPGTPFFTKLAASLPVTTAPVKQADGTKADDPMTPIPGESYDDWCKRQPDPMIQVTAAAKRSDTKPATDADEWDENASLHWIGYLLEQIENTYKLLNRTDLPADLKPARVVLDLLCDQHGGETWSVLEYALGDEEMQKKMKEHNNPISWFAANYATIAALAPVWDDEKEEWNDERYACFTPEDAMWAIAEVRRVYKLLGRDDAPEDIFPIVSLMVPVIYKDIKEGRKPEHWDDVMAYALYDEKGWKPNMKKSAKKYDNCPLRFFVANYDVIRAEADEKAKGYPKDGDVEVYEWDDEKYAWLAPGRAWALVDEAHRIYKLLGRMDRPKDLSPAVKLMVTIIDREEEEEEEVAELWGRVLNFALADEKVWKPNMKKNGCPIAYFVANFDQIREQADEKAAA